LCARSKRETPQLKKEIEFQGSRLSKIYNEFKELLNSRINDFHGELEEEKEARL
jgi:hypothetical protein